MFFEFVLHKLSDKFRLNLECMFGNINRKHLPMVRQGIFFVFTNVHDHILIQVVHLSDLVGDGDKISDLWQRRNYLWLYWFPQFTKITSFLTDPLAEVLLEDHF